MGNLSISPVRVSKYSGRISLPIRAASLVRSVEAPVCLDVAARQLDGADRGCCAKIKPVCMIGMRPEQSN